VSVQQNKCYMQHRAVHTVQYIVTPSVWTDALKACSAHAALGDLPGRGGIAFCFVDLAGSGGFGLLGELGSGGTVFFGLLDCLPGRGGVVLLPLLLPLRATADAPGSGGVAFVRPAEAGSGGVVRGLAGAGAVVAAGALEPTPSSSSSSSRLPSASSRAL